MKIAITIFLMIFLITSCSLFTSKDPVIGNVPEKKFYNKLDEEFPHGKDVALEQEKEDQEILEEDMESESEVAEAIEERDVEVGEDIVNPDRDVASPVIHDNSGIAKYTVKSGDTLMLIAFSLYGNHLKWRDIAKLNGVNYLELIVGMTLKYRVPHTPFNYRPRGTPYLIRNGDTLGTISNTVYNTNKRWRDIWNNNREIIYNPNLIFAGFTIYYIPENLAQN